MFIWVNGEYVSDDQPVISGSDRGFLYGDGLFETLRVYPDTKSGVTTGKIFLLDEHIARLSSSAKELKIPLPVSQQSFRGAINRLLKLNKLVTARVRITVSRGKEVIFYAKTTHSEIKPTIIIETEPCPDYTKEKEAGVKCIIASYRRSVESPLFRHKTLSFLDNVLARGEAQERKAFETIFLNSRNNLAEGSMSNVFVVRKGRVLTPSLDDNILPGITRQLVLGLCTGRGVPVREKSLKMKELLNADEVFLTNSIIEIMPVVKCNRSKIGTGKPGRITHRLQQSYQTLTD